jgi:hypothetical protein
MKIESFNRFATGTRHRSKAIGIEAVSSEG